MAQARAAVDQNRRALRDERKTVEEKLTRQLNQVEAMTLAADRDRQLAADARKEAEYEARAVKALRMRLALIVGKMVRWLRRDDLALDARKDGSGLILKASEMMSGASDSHPDPGMN